MEKANKSGIFSKLKILILNNKAKCILHGVLKAHTLFCLVWTLIDRNWLCFGYSIITLLLFMLPTLCQIILKIELPFSLEAVVMLFIWAAMVLGDVYDWYVVFPHWDTLLHTVTGFVAAAVGMGLVNVMNKDDKFALKLSPLFVAIFCFSVSMMVGAMWELFEYCIDLSGITNMQKDTLFDAVKYSAMGINGETVSGTVKDIAEMQFILKDGTLCKPGLAGYMDMGLIDSIEDMFVNFIGALVFAVIAYLYVKKGGKNKVLNSFIEIKKQDPLRFIKNK